MPDSTEVTAQDAVNQDFAPEQAPVQTEIDYVAKAKELGWNESYDGIDRVDAKEFVQRAPLYDKLKTQNKRLKDQEKALKDMAGHIQSIQDAAYKKAMSDLNREKREAVENADFERVTQIDQTIEELKPIKPVPKTDDGVNPVITEWVNRPENKWFTTDKKLQAFAIAYQDSLLKDDPTLDPEESLKEVSKAVKKAFPDKFTNPARIAAPVIDGGTSSDKGKKNYTYRDLTEDQRKIADRFERTGIMKKETYIKQLADSGLIGG